LAYVRKVRREVGPGEVLNVIIPETVANFGLRYIVRERRLQRLKAALLAEPDVVVTNLVHHIGYEDLEPGERAHRGRAPGANADPHTFVTIVIPEFVVRKAWHNLLHNHTPLVLKRTFLFEPSVVVAAVPYRLDLIPGDAPAEVAPA